MNMRVQPPSTPAEAALVSTFGERLALLPGGGEVMTIRDRALEQVKAGLPTRRVESWHYPDLRRLMPVPPLHDDTVDARPLTPLLAGSTVVSMLNGVAPAAAAIPGLRISPLREKLLDGSFAP